MEEGGLSLDGVSKDYCFRNWRFSERAKCKAKSILEESQDPQFVYNMKVMEIEKGQILTGTWCMRIVQCSTCEGRVSSASLEVI